MTTPIRIFLALLLILTATLAAQASDAISAPAQGASTAVTQPHVTAELIPETTSIQGGQPFAVALHLHMDSDWHTYWINPGDAGLATTITWTLPDGFTAGPIQWPVPERHNMGPLVTFGYGGDVYLLTTITPPKSIPQGSNTIRLKAHAEWLVCQEECIPGRADFDLPLDSGLMTLRLPAENKDFFAQARERLPVPNTRWDVTANYDPKLILHGAAENPGILIRFRTRPDASDGAVGHLEFFPEQPNVLSAQEQNLPGGRPPPENKGDSFILALPLEQNGDKPGKLSGVLVSDQPLIGDGKAVSIAEFSVAVTPQAQGSAAAMIIAEQTSPHAATLATLGIYLLAAFIGGLILNLMPCVLPVLSLKVFSLMKHAGDDPRKAWMQGAAFTAGVVISFWLLAGLLLALRAAGNQLGWGFQMQSPGFVLALIFIFFLLALNLFGVFELGSSLVGLDAKATGHLSGLPSSFANGALATLAATPCTAPFMGSSLGFAAQQPPLVALLIFTFLAFGMATPYLLLTIFPGALRFVPKPGAWMEAFRQVMGFFLLATVVFLLYVFGALVGPDQIPSLLIALLILSLAAWVYGRWSTPARSYRVRVTALAIALFFLAIAIKWGVWLALTPPESTSKNQPDGQANLDWQPWSPSAVEQALSSGRPVFVDFTAAWCLSCKVNERIALDTDAIRAAFAQKNVALFRADWTHSDPEISKTLRQFNRDGVPLYLLYSPHAKETPKILPEVLTPGLVLDALKTL